jgi:hypothetical protein
VERDLPHVTGDADVIAFNTRHRCDLIAKVEGETSGQPEQKLYKAIGQGVGHPKVPVSPCSGDQGS